jgi:hypothetical protein
MSARDLAEQVLCPHCPAVIGERCITRSGNTATWPHGARTQALYDAWFGGYEEGEYGMARMVLDALGLADVAPDDTSKVGRLLGAAKRAVRDWEANR